MKFSLFLTSLFLSINLFAQTKQKINSDDSLTVVVQIKGKEREIISFYSNGVIQEHYTVINSKNNYFTTYHGIYISYHRNGAIDWVKHYYYGTAIGTWKKYYPNGQIELEESYLTTFPLKKQIAVEYTVLMGVSSIGSSSSVFFSGIPNGVWKKWYPNGQLEYVKNISKAKLSGECIHYHENGNVKSVGLYESDSSSLKNKYKIIVENPLEIEEKIFGEVYPVLAIKKGLWKYYNENGVLIKEELW